jgi:hypothetical protein
VKPLIDAAARYYNATPVASILLLGGPFSRSAYRAQEVTIENIGRAVRDLFLRLKPAVKLPDEPDVATFAVEIAFACMKYGYFREGRISEVVIAESTKAVIGYLANWE